MELHEPTATVYSFISISREYRTANLDAPLLPGPQIAHKAGVVNTSKIMATDDPSLLSSPLRRRPFQSSTHVQHSLFGELVEEIVGNPVLPVILLNLFGTVANGNADNLLPQHI